MLGEARSLVEQELNINLAYDAKKTKKKIQYAVHKGYVCVYWIINEGEREHKMPLQQGFNNKDNRFFLSNNEILDVFYEYDEVVLYFRTDKKPSYEQRNEALQIVEQLFGQKVFHNREETRKKIKGSRNYRAFVRVCTFADEINN